MLRTGMFVTSVAGQAIEQGGPNIAALIRGTARPFMMSFRDPLTGEDVVQTFDKGPIGLRFRKCTDSDGRVVVSGFSKSKGPVERNGQVLVGHVLTHVESQPVGDSASLATKLVRQALEACGDREKRKVVLTFRDMDLYMELYPSTSPKRTHIGGGNGRAP